MRFWVSWVQGTEDYRPLTYPPNKAILGWWCSGHVGNGGATLCAVVEAEDEAEAQRALIADWPEVAEVDEMRFTEPRPDDFKPGDRFPLEPWMIKRFSSRRKAG